MASNFERLFGQASLVHMRNLNADRSRYLTPLTDSQLWAFVVPVPDLPPVEPGGRPPVRPAGELVALNGAERVMTLATLLREAPAGALTAEQTGAFFGLFNRAVGALTGAEILTFVGELAPLTPLQMLTLLGNLLDPAGTVSATVVRQRLAAWTGALADGRVTLEQISTAVAQLRGQLSQAHLHETLGELHPCTGTLLHRLWTDLCDGAGGLGGTHFRELIHQLRVPADPVTALTTVHIDELVHDLRTNGGTNVDGATGTQIRETLRALLTHAEPLTPAQCRVLLRHLRVPRRLHVNPVDVRDLIASTAGERQHRAIRPRWLLAAVAQAVGGQTFAEHLNTCVPLTPGGFGHMRNLLVRMDQHTIPAEWAVRLLQVFSQLGSTPYARMSNFLIESGQAVAAAGGGATWTNAVLDHLNNFLTAGRRPHGARHTRYAHTEFGGAIGGAEEGTRAQGLVTVKLYAGSTNYFCNAHTFAHCDFTERRGRVGVPHISFWPPETLKPGVIAIFNGIAGPRLFGLATGYGYRKSEDGLDPEFGLSYDRAASDRTGRRVYSITHLQPLVGIQVRMTVLAALSRLFDTASTQ